MLCSSAETRERVDKGNAARRLCWEKKEVRGIVTDDSRWENVCVCGNILVDVGITATELQSERASEQTSEEKQ